MDASHPTHLSSSLVRSVVCIPSPWMLPVFSLGLLPILLLLLVLVSNQWLAKKSKSATRRKPGPSTGRRVARPWPPPTPRLPQQHRPGASPALVVSTREAAKECFTANDKALAGRPPSAASKPMCYNNAMVGFSSYGPYLRRISKILNPELLSHAWLGSHAHVRDSDVGAFAKTLYGLRREGDGDPARVEISKWFQELTFNVVVRMVAGKRCFGYGAVDDGGGSEARRFNGAMHRMMELLGERLRSPRRCRSSSGWIWAATRGR